MKRPTSFCRPNTAKFDTHADHFIGFFEPFVWSKKSAAVPSIRQNKPFVRFSGFTLIELVVTLAVVAVLSLIVAPSFRGTIQNSRITGLTNDLLSDINVARTEAVKRVVNVGICMSASGTTCDGSSWTGRRIIFIDANNDGAFTPGTPANEVVLRVREPLNNNTLTSATAPNPIIFGPRGLPMSPNTTVALTSPINFSLCDSRGASKGRLISISVTGQASSSPSPGSC